MGRLADHLELRRHNIEPPETFWPSRCLRPSQHAQVLSATSMMISSRGRYRAGGNDSETIRPLSSLLHCRQRPNATASLDAPSRRGSVNYMVVYIYEPIPSTRSHLPNYALAARWGKDTAYEQGVAAGNSLICVLLNLRRARLFDPRDAALDGPLVPRRFPRSTPLQHVQEPCEWQRRWQMSSPSSHRPIPHGGLSRG
jgi:hypothetical protein